MKRLAIVAFVAAGALAGCPGKHKQGSTSPATGSGSSTVLAKKLVVTWGITQGATSAEIFLQTTDETGHQVSRSAGTYKGTCSATKPAPEMKALSAVICKDGATGTEIDAVTQVNEIIVLKLRIDDGVTPDPMAREEVLRVDIPVGIAVESGV